MKGQKLLPITLAVSLLSAGGAVAQSGAINIPNGMLDRGTQAQAARGKETIDVSDKILERGTRAQAARSAGGTVSPVSDDVLERGKRAQAARGKEVINASDEVLERGGRAQAARAKGVVDVSDDVLERGTRAQAARAKGVVDASDDVLERGTRAQAARVKGVADVSDDVVERGTRAQAARGKNVATSADDVASSKAALNASDDLAAGASKGGAMKSATQGAAGGAALYLGVDVGMHVAQGGELKDYEVNKEELALEVAIGAAGPAGGGVYAAYRIVDQEQNDPGKTWRDIKNGDINISATDAVMIGGVKGLAAWGTYKFLEQELNEPGKTREDAYIYIEQITGEPLSEQDKKDIDTALMFYVPGYAVYKLAVQEAIYPGKTREDAYAYVENDLGIPLTDREKQNIDLALSTAIPTYSYYKIYANNSDEVKSAVTYLISPKEVIKRQIDMYQTVGEFAMELHNRKTAWQRIALVETADHLNTEDMVRLFAPVPAMPAVQNAVLTTAEEYTFINNAKKASGEINSLGHVAGAAGGRVVDDVKGFGSDAAAWGKNGVRHGLETTQRGVQRLGGDVHRGAQVAGQHIHSATHKLGQQIGEGAQNVGHAVAGTAASGIEKIGNTAEKVGNAAGQAAGKAKNTAKEATEKVGGLLR